MGMLEAKVECDVIVLSVNQFLRSTYLLVRIKNHVLGYWETEGNAG